MPDEKSSKSKTKPDPGEGRSCVLRGIAYLAKRQIDVFYKDHRLEKRYALDSVVLDVIVVELKAVVALTADHEAQLINYRRISRSPS